MKKFYVLSLILCLYVLPVYSCYEIMLEQDNLNDEPVGTMFDLSILSPLNIGLDDEVSYKPADINELEPLFETSSITSSTKADEKLERSFIKAFIQWLVQLGDYESANTK
jgi:hypothetical protein